MNSEIELMRNIANMEIEHIKQLTREPRNAIQSIPGVVTSGISLDDKGHNITIYIKDRNIIDTIPQQINGIPTKTVVIKEFKLLPLSQSSSLSSLPADADVKIYRPIRPGIAISPTGSWIGTLGAIGYGPNNERIIISCNHIMFQPNPDDNIGWLGQAIYQPYMYCFTNNKIGNLRSYVPIVQTAQVIDNLADVAYATIDPNIQIEETDKYGNTIGSSADPVLNEDVGKCGAATGYTEGKIISLDINIIMQTQAGYRFVDNIIADVVGAQGDSGSVLTSKLDNSAIGVIFGAIVTEEGQWLTVACKARNVENLLGIRFGPVPPPPVVDAKYSCTSGGCNLDIVNGQYNTIKDCLNICPTSEPPKHNFNKCDAIALVTFGVGLIGLYYISKNK